MVFCLTTMLLGDFPSAALKDVSVQMWNGPLDSSRPCPFFIDVIGVIEDYHVLSVCIFLFSLSIYVLFKCLTLMFCS